MDRKNLNQIFDAYISQFEYLNNDENDENYKWLAVAEFQKVFDLDAPTDGFAGMLKEARDATHNIIDSYMQPFYGLVELARKEPETVRAMLIALLEDDGGDLTARQEKIDTFLEECDRLVDAYFPGSHLYKNDQRSAMAYMFFHDPDHHYLYKATEAKYMADCIGFYDDWGTMASFKLDVYYRFCDELIEQIKVASALMDTNRSRFLQPKAPMFEDDALHVLVFDIIYCAHTYNLYSGLKIDKVNSADRKLHLERKEKAQELYAALCKAEEDARQLDEATAYFTSVIQSGAVVTHKTFGEVEVGAMQMGMVQYIIKKDGQKKWFGLLFSIAGGFLTIAVDGFAEKVTQYKAVMLREKDIPVRLKEAQKNMEPYKKYLDC